MTKKNTITILISLLFFTSIFNFGTTNASAATQDVTLTTNQSSSSTSRVTATKNLLLIINNKGDKTIHYTIFKNGEAWLIGSDYFPGEVLQDKYNVAPGEYSVRLYCGTRYTPTTGCKATGTLTSDW
ncbi:hypothetical protein [Viridibacillus arvi]|uniref:hypothetical protein n=1 Tax=Viridibacillus arvi TaxID=263475 RepID=UPI003D2E6E72